MSIHQPLLLVHNSLVISLLMNWLRKNDIPMLCLALFLSHLQVSCKQLIEVNISWIYHIKLINGADESTKRVKGKIGSAIARLARRSLMVAARERKAFGLRPSDSEEYHQQFENIRQHPPCEDHLLEIPAARVSGISEDTFSRGASHLFQAIEAKQQPPSRYSTIRTDGNVIREPVSIPNSCQAAWIPHLFGFG